MTTLANIRKQITTVREQIAEVESAPLPFDTTEEKIRNLLERTTEYKRTIVSSLAASFTTGDVDSYLLSLSERGIAKAALSLGVAALGIENIIAEARNLAEASDNGRLKLTAADKASRLRELRTKLYALEFDEENARSAVYDGVQARRRNDIRYPGAVLGIPVELAVEAGLLV